MSLPRILSISFDNLSGIARNVLLAQSGYAVSPATSTTRAFELLNELRFDLVIIGDTVPTNERRLLFLEIKRKFNIPVLLMDSDEVDSLMRASAHIGKDATPEQLMKTVASVAPIKHNKRAGMERRAAERRAAAAANMQEPSGC
jgi:DNA-binding NtrC family response regulator